MSKRVRFVPGVFAHVVMSLLAFLMMLCILLTGLTAVPAVTISSRYLQTSLAEDPTLLAAQAERIDTRIAQLAEKQSFDPVCLSAWTSPEALRLYSQDMAAWWPTLLVLKKPASMPSVSRDDVTNAVMDDPLFQSTHDAGKQKSVARDKVAGKVVSILQESIMPIRANLITTGIVAVSKKIDVRKYTAVLPWLPLLCLGAAAMLAGMMQLLCLRRPVRGLAFTGSALAAGGVLTLLVILVVALMNLPGIVGAYSPVLSAAVTPWLRQMGLYLGLWAAVLIIIGLLLMLAHQKRMAFIRRRAGSDL